MRSSIFLACCCFLWGCSARVPAVEPVRPIVTASENPVMGTVKEPWVEPMFDQVQMPGQLDPAGNYYRLPHQTTVEIRHDRFEDVRYEEEGGR